MNGSSDHTEDDAPEVLGGAGWKRKRVIFSGVAIALIALMFLTAWMSREQFAKDFISEQLAQYDLPATYEIESIGSREQIFTDVVVGDPAAPDFTADRIKAEIEYRFGAPTIGTIEISGARLYGSYKDQVLSFGALDAVLFEGETTELALPELDLNIVDGRALLETEYGPVGLKIDGNGDLADGFSGTFAATAPKLAVQGCEAEDTTLFGEITTSNGAPKLIGPLRAASISCAEQGVRVGDLAAQIEASSDATFAQFALETDFTTSRLNGRSAGFAASAEGAEGVVRGAFASDRLTIDHDVRLLGFAHDYVNADEMRFDGAFRSSTDLRNFDVRGDLSAEGANLSASAMPAVGSANSGSSDAFIAPLMRKFTRAVKAQLRDASFEAPVIARMADGALTLAIPSARVRNARGQPLISASQIEYQSSADGLPRFAGNIVTNGDELPRISGRMETSSAGLPVFRMRMAPYSAGNSTAALPEMQITQQRGGAMTIDGAVRVSGTMYDVAFTDAQLPVTGLLERSGALSLGNSCARVKAGQVSGYGASFAQPAVTLCPGAGGAIARMSDGDVQISAVIPEFALLGAYEDAPLRIASAGGRFNSASGGTLEGVSLSYGGAEDENQVSLERLELGGGANDNGSFTGLALISGDLPISISEGSGTWGLTEDGAQITSAVATIADKQDFARFNPIFVNVASVDWARQQITGIGSVHSAKNGARLAEFDMLHRLDSAAGSARITVPGLTFNEGLQPVDLSELARGVIALADGTVTGQGRIEWNEQGVASSGQLSTQGFDFAAAFGPVQGVSGTINFTDLINLTTAPSQSLSIAAINPGVEVMDGEMTFSLTNGQLVQVEGGRWPFMGGELILRPTRLDFAVEEDRSYVFEIVGLDAASFVQTLELSNLSATGTFDGTLPIVFDTDGNGQIIQGLLISRQPGGNVSYVGDLTYTDVGAMANFAFNALRSLNYTQMTVGMEGPLTGEIVTRVRFDGVSQGDDASRNLVTRQLAKLPLQFRVNVRAQFYQLLTSMKSLYDPASVRDPRELGLLGSDGVRFRRLEDIERENQSQETQSQELGPEDEQPATSVIQDQESENRP
ncbi:intermembrane phospholipid transport protein YdbH family protein [Qipengyuania sp. DGS5-3]|uniref:intermembrane phospholipid transport protein YdbH family protein n=1 Tax=Qipengyuania sp. DGS5-3 TaxID=3349632 RepID=UPI0036D2556F